MAKDHFKAHPNDFIIVIMGPTGSGKSHFINILTGNSEQHSASNLKSDTQSATPYIVEDHGARIVLVDTPGFDDTHRPDSVVLREVADWLTQKYSNGATLKISGIVYLHRISDNRMTGSAYKNLQLFGRLCGNIALRRARLVTTMWDKVKDQELAKDRETQLKYDFWSKLLEEGADARRFDNTKTCARDIVRELVDLGRDEDELLLQEELVEQQKHLNETEAGKVLYSRVQRLLAEQKKTLKELADEAKLQNDPVRAKSLQEECDKINMQLQKTFDEMKAMKIPIGRRIISWFRGGKTRAQAVKLDPPAPQSSTF